jgi:hypothetical protein
MHNQTPRRVLAPLVVAALLTAVPVLGAPPRAEPAPGASADAVASRPAASPHRALEWLGSALPRLLDAAIDRFGLDPAGGRTPSPRRARAADTGGGKEIGPTLDPNGSR